MPDPFVVLLDQNVPRAVVNRLRALRPSWDVRHASEVGLAGKSDRETIEETQAGLERLLAEVPESELKGALVIIDRTRIRVRPGELGKPKNP